MNTLNNLNIPTRVAGFALIVLGLVVLLNLWSLIPAVLLAGVGVAIYRRERSGGRVSAAIQGGLWGVGLALLYLVGAVFPGVLLLGGVSLLLRGKEDEADQRVQTAISRVKAAAEARRARRISNQPINAAATPSAPTVVEGVRSGETTRLG